MKIIHVYPASCEYAYPKYLDRTFNPDRFDIEIMTKTDLEVRYLKGIIELGEESILLYPRRFKLPIKEFKHEGGYKIVRFPVSFFKGKNGREYSFKMLKYIKNNKPDLVHFHGIYSGGKFFFIRFFIFMGLFCKLYKIPFFGWYHVGNNNWGEKENYLRKYSLFKKIFNFLRKAPLELCTGITSINQIELEKLFNKKSDIYYNIGLKDIPHLYTPNTIDRKTFYPVDRQFALKELNLSSDKRYILTVARLTYSKGIHILINIIPHLINQDRDLHFLIIGEFIEGEESYKQEIFQSIERKNISNNISFLGRVEHDDGLNLYYNIASVFILPTLQETFGGVNLEALACHLPVVSTDCGEIPYYLKTGLGFVVPKNNEMELKNAVEKVLFGDFQLDTALLEKTLKEFDYKNTSKKLLDWYKKVLYGNS